MNQSPAAYVGFEAVGLGCALHDALHEGFSAYRNAPSPRPTDQNKRLSKEKRRF